jgi:hypothetical protein
MKQLLQSFLWYCCLCTYLPLMAQQSNMQKYWNYKDRFRKDFVKIGKAQGESIPFTSRVIGMAYAGDSTGSRIYLTDATIYIGHYLTMLAMEHQNLLEAYNNEQNNYVKQKLAKSLNECRNEIYYALATLVRLDLYAEDYLSQGSNTFTPDDINGLLMRDDIKEDFHENFIEDYSEIFQRDCNFARSDGNYNHVYVYGREALPEANSDNCGNVSAYPPGGQSTFNCGNMVTLDQITTLITGLYTVWKLLPEGYTVQPTSADDPIGIKEEARNIAVRIIENIVRPQGDGVVAMNIRTVDNFFRPAGYDCTFAAPFLFEIGAKMGSPEIVQILSEYDYDEIELAFQLDPRPLAETIEAIVDADEVVWGDLIPCMNNMLELLNTHIFFHQPITVAQIKLNSVRTFFEIIEEQNVDFTIDGNPCLTVDDAILDIVDDIDIKIEGTACDLLAEYAKNRILILLGAAVDVSDMYDLFLYLNSLGEDEFELGVNICMGEFLKLDEDNIHITLELAAVSDLWSNAYITSLATESNLHWYPMLQALLHNDMVLSNNDLKDFVKQEYLDSAPCGGGWDNPDYDFEGPDNPSLPDPASPEGWRSANRLFHNGNAYRGEPELSYRGEYSGIDYMVYYNLYRLLWPENEPPYHREITCQCIEEITAESALSSSFLIKRKFPDYLDKGIPIESYLAHDLLVDGASTILDVKNDFVICSPAEGITTTLTLNNGAELKLYDGNTLTIRAGNKLILDGNSALRGGYSTPESQDAGITVATIVLEPGAELHVLNGSLFQPYAGMKIFLQQGAKFIVDNSDVIFHQNSSGSGFYLEGANTELVFQNNSVWINNSPAPTFSTLENHATLKVTDSYVDMPNSVITFRDYCVLNTQNSALDFAGSALELNNHCVHNFYHSEMTLDNSHINVLNASVFHQIESELNISNNGYLTFDDGEEPFSATSVYAFYGGELSLEGTDSYILFDNGKLEIAHDKTFQPTHANALSGYIEFTGPNEEDIFLGDNSVFSLVGDGPQDVMLKINNYANLRNGQDGTGKIHLEDCKVDLSNHGRLWTDLKVNAAHVVFDDGLPDVSSDDGGDIQVWNNNTCNFYDCDFQHTDLKTYNSHLGLSACDFLHRQSGVRCQQGFFVMNNCFFEDSYMVSQSLDQFSTMTECDFITNGTCFSDESLVEIRMERCEFKNADFGVKKTGGVLSLKCCLFQEISQDAVNMSYGVLNLSAENAAGYNIFDQVGTCIQLWDVTSVQLNKGYNNLSGYSSCCICGTMSGYFLKQEGLCEGAIMATGNYWGAPQNTFPPSPQVIGAYDPLRPEVIISVFATPCESYCNIHGANGWSMGCSIHFVDKYISIPSGCGASQLVPHRARSRVAINASEEQQYINKAFGLDHSSATVHELRDLTIDPNNPILSTATFSGIALDSALIVAAAQMEICNGAGSDATAVELFHEILSSPLDRGNAEIRWKMEWGRYNMKSAMEHMFLTDELHEENNAATFEPAVGQYVEVLNAMTDTVLTDSTYKEQFYLELDKGQLFRTLNNPLMAKHIYMHLDDCQLDSTEQAMLNNWRAEVDLELSLYNQSVLENISPDSISFEVDTTAYTPAVPYSSSDYFFGLWIDSPTSVTFVNCGDNPVYKSSWSSSNAFAVYPNPTSGAITIEVEQTGMYKFEIFDASGRSIYKTLLNMQESTTCNLELPSAIARGNYVIKLEGGNGIYIDRLVKQ